MDSGMLVLLAGLLGFVAVAGVGVAIAGGGNSNAKTVKRAQAITANRDRENRARTRQANSADSRRKQIVNSLKEQEKQTKKAQLTLSAKLQQAGLSISTTQFWIFSLVLGAVIFAGALLATRNPIIAILGAFAGTLGLPTWIIGFLGQRRMKKFTESFSNAMDIIVRGIKSGLPVHDCLKIIAREAPQPLAGEFQKLVENIGMGMTFEQGLDKMYERMPTNELRFFAIVMNVQSKTGGNLAEALGNLSAVLRARKLMREKIKALSSEATASAMIIGVLPPGVVILISVTAPTYMVPMFTDPRGKMMLLGGAVWMATGIYVMRKMINFKF